MIFNDRIKFLRQEKNITQENTARALNLTLRSYQRLEADGSTPSYQSLITLADYYNVSMDYLAGRTDIKEINR